VPAQPDIKGTTIKMNAKMECKPVLVRFTVWFSPVPVLDVNYRSGGWSGSYYSNPEVRELLSGHLSISNVTEL
jgi:hypothetical protein